MEKGDYGVKTGRGGGRVWGKTGMGRREVCGKTGTGENGGYMVKQLEEWKVCNEQGQVREYSITGAEGGNF